MPTDLDQGGNKPQLTRTYAGPTDGWLMTDAPTYIEYVMEGGGQPLTVGQYGHLVIPEWLRVTKWRVLADQSGTIQLDIWKDTYANFPPTIADSIVGSDPPKTTAAQKNSSELLTGWTVNIDQQDILAFVVTSTSSVITRVTLTLECIRLKGPPAQGTA